MLKRILDIVGWIGFGLVIIAVLVTLVPALDRFAAYSRPLAIGGFACVLLYTLGQWREIADMFQGRQARYGRPAAPHRPAVLRILLRFKYNCAKANKRSSLT